MSRTNPSICCSRCGRIIYEPLTARDLREKGFAKHISGYYAVNDNGKEDELCEKCYTAWKSEPYCHGPVGIICERDCDDLCSYWRP